MANTDKNENLKRAKAAQEDEFYTQYEDISNELVHYADKLRGKRIICPCDWDESLDEVLVYASEEHIQGTDNLFAPEGIVKVIDHAKVNGSIVADINEVKCSFVKFLLAHAEDWGIASIAVSGYDPARGKGVKFQDLDYSKYDVVITNPPFSQFRELIDTLFKNDMEFLIIGNQNAITYKECFSRIMANQMWLGYHNGDMKFKVPDDYEERATRFWIDDEGQKWRSLGNISWFTNLDIEKRHDEQILTEEYDPEKYPEYDNYAGVIEVSKGKDIPYDYDGIMAVPITWLPKYNPDQFEILGIMDRQGSSGLRTKVYTVEDSPKYNDLNARGVIIKDGQYKAMYARILIRNKNPYIEKDQTDGE